MIAYSAEAGAWAAKIQTFFADDLSDDWRSKDYVRLKECELDWDAHERFVELSSEHGLEPITSVYSSKYAVKLRDLGFKYVKVGSAQALDSDLIAKYNRYGFKIIISTGGRDVCDIPKRKYWAVLHCVSTYPHNPYESDLKRIIELQRKFDCKVGFSSHCNPIHPNWDWPIKFAQSIGASVFEIHFTTKPRHEVKDGVVSVTFPQLRDICAYEKLSIEQRREQFPMLGLFDFAKKQEERELINRYRGRWK